MRALGVDVVRTNVIFYKVYNQPSQRKRPAGFDAADPNSPSTTGRAPTAWCTWRGRTASRC